MKKKILSVTLALVLTLAAFAFEPGFTMTAFAAETSGTFISMPAGGFNSSNTGTGANKTVRISGHAALDGNGGVAIVPNAGNKAGGVFFTQPIQQGSGFSTSFKIRMGAKGGMGTGDGFCFIIANGTNQVGAIGSGIGYSGITKSIAIEYDTYDNNSGGSSGSTPHIWFGNNGVMDTKDTKKTVLFEGSNAKRNAVNYDVYGWAEYDADKNTLAVTFSSTSARPSKPTILIQSGANDKEESSGGTLTVTRKDFDPSSPSSPYYIGSQYYMGFTSATGGAYQQVTLQSFTAYGEYVESTGDSKIVNINGKEVDIGDSLDLPKITPPNPPSGTDGVFQGMYDEDGVQYYDENGNGVHANDLDEGDVLYARFAYTIRLKNQGVADSTMSAEDGAPLPAAVPVPVRDGYTFAGYWDAITGDKTQYYNANGSRTQDGDWYAASGPSTLYATWTKGNATVTVDLGGGTWTKPEAFEGSGPYTVPGGAIVTLPVPAKADEIFGGWTVTGDGGYVAANGRTFTAIGGTVTLTAAWRTPATAFEDRTGEGNITGDAANLAEAYKPQNLAADPEMGVTAADLESGAVKLTLYVDDVSDGAGVDAINAMAARIGGDETLRRMKYYDIYVEKEVDSVTIRLKEIPEIVTVRLPVSGASSYIIYHYHDGAVRTLTDDKTAEEYFEIEGSEMLIHVRRFSEFGILPNGRTIGPVGEAGLADDPMNGDNEPGMDVQGKVSEGTLSGNYKIDIAWGSMKFEFSVGKEWNPDTHEYSGAVINEWIPTVDSTCYLGGNNQITTYNHSNDAVTLDFTVGSTAAYLDGVDIKIFTANTDAGSPALGVPLDRVAYSGDPIAPSEDVFVRLLGSPNDVEAFIDAQAGGVNFTGWNKVAMITVTITPVRGTLTPVN